MKNSEKDSVANILKWVLLITALACFAVLAWGTYKTYQEAPPLPEKFVTATGKIILSQHDIVEGKAGFQRADLMDFGSIYGMGSYFGEDYTAQYLVRLGELVNDSLSQQQFKKPFTQLDEGKQHIIRKTMQQSLQHIDLSYTQTILSPAVAFAIHQLQTEISQALLNNDFAQGWTRAYSLNQKSALQVADFLIYSSITTIAHRPDKNYSYTNNWPYEPSVGNVPTTNTFLWTWLSFCFVFLGFGAVLYVYHRYLSGPDTGIKAPTLITYQPLTASQKKTGQYFIIVALVLLLQIGAGALLAHYYVERADFYGINIASFLPFNFLRDVHLQTPLVWIGMSWISAALFLLPLMSGQEAKGQAPLITILFWVTLFIIVGALLGNYLDIMGYLTKSWFWLGNQGLSYIQMGRFWQLGFFIGLL